MGNLSGRGTLRGSLGAGGGSSRDVYWDDILNKPEFAPVATSGSYNDLTDKPPVPTVMTGATAQLDGAAGYAPQPLAGDENKFLNGAGEWVQAPSSQVNYSTGEQIIGTWIDGYPLYRKILTNLNITPLYNNWTDIGDIPDNADKYIGSEFIFYEGPNGNIDLSHSGLEITFANSEGKIKIEYNQNVNLRPISIVSILYTKNTNTIGGE